MFCEQCGARVDEGLLFCTSCGELLRREPEAVQEAVAPEEFEPAPAPAPAAPMPGAVVPVAVVPPSSATRAGGVSGSKGPDRNRKLIAVVAVVSVVVVLIAALACFYLFSSSHDSTAPSAPASSDATRTEVVSPAPESQAPAPEAASDVETVPDVVGKSVDDATAQLKNAGFVVGTVQKEASESVGRDCVMSQSVEGGAKLSKNASISLVVSSGPAKRTYSVIPGKKTWEEAEAYCESRGGTLACPSSQAEYDEVLSLAKSSGYKVFWLGGRLSGSSFEWVDGTPVEYAAWAPGEPNNDEGIEDKMALFNAEGSWGWYDVPNDFGKTYPAEKMAFIMEAPEK